MSAETERSIAKRSGSGNIAPWFGAGVHRSRILGICGLAILIISCAFGYKLMRHTTQLAPATRLSFMKLWDRHEDTRLTSALEPTTQSYSQSSLRVMRSRQA